MEADKSHIHHLLMRQFGHRNTVIIMCGLTALFGLSAFAILVTGLFCLDVTSFRLPSLREEWLVFVVGGLGVLGERG